MTEEEKEPSEEYAVLSKKLEYDYLIARLALQGTLWGAWAALFTILLIVFSPIFTERDLVQGWEIVTIVGLLVVSVVAYGAFIFNRALTISARTEKEGIASFTASSPNRRE